MEVPFYVVGIKSEHDDASLIYEAISDGDWFSSKLAALATMDQKNEAAEMYGNAVRYTVYGGKLG